MLGRTASKEQGISECGNARKKHKRVYDLGTPGWERGSRERVQRSRDRLRQGWMAPHQPVDGIPGGGDRSSSPGAGMSSVHRQPGQRKEEVSR